MKQSMLMVNPGRRYGVISRHLYGHFTEHLGRCIYQGIYVGEDSGIPAVRGIRSDVAEALRKVSVPVVRWPVGALPKPTTGRMAWARRRRASTLSTATGAV